MKSHSRLEGEHIDKPRSAITRLTIGSFIVLVGILMVLRQTGIIANKIDILP